MSWVPDRLTDEQLLFLADMAGLLSVAGRSRRGAQVVRPARRRRCTG
jgi:hypothetical protein